jgi:lipopolysaccharide biosynthesis glycosyltransferase
MTTVKILTGYHKPAVLPSSTEVFTPIHLGRAQAATASKDGVTNNESLAWLEQNMIGDNTGENISQINRKFCEITAIYWAWKNYDKLDNPEYIGFQHYRRHFDFSDKEVKAFPTKYPLFDKSYEEEINLNNDSIKNIVKDYDLLIPKKQTVSDYDKTVYNHYLNFHNHHIEDLDILLDVIDKDYPHLSKYAKECMNDNSSYFCNMFIMKKDLFLKYAETTVDILIKTDNRISYENRSYEKMRAIGFLSERMTSIYLKYLQDTHDLKVKNLNITELQNTDLAPVIKPFKSKNNIPVVLSSDNNYAKYLGVTIQSIVNHSKDVNNYDILVLDGGISKNAKRLISKSVENHDNISVRFIDIKQYTTDIDLSIFTLTLHFEVPTYYRFFIPKILSNYDEVVYLDCDLVVNNDIADFFNKHKDLGDNLIAATVDTEIVRVINNKDNYSNEMSNYIKNILKLDDPYSYIQAGVLIFNNKKMIEESTTDKFIERLKEIGTPKFVDQCVINSVCKNRIKYFEQEWNVPWHIAICNEYEKELPAEKATEYTQALNNPKIIHYTSQIKPWKQPELMQANLFWENARNSYFYEEIIFSNTNIINNNQSVNNIVSDNSSSKFKSKYSMYKILSKITFGKLKKKFKNRKNHYKYMFEKSREGI